MRKQTIIFTLILLFILAGCGQKSSGEPEKAEAESSSGSSLKITDFADRDISFDQAPKKIAALSNGDMDIIYALGGELVGRPTARGPIAVPEAKDAIEIGSTHEIDVEKLTAAQPEVVLANDPMNMKDIPAIEGTGAQAVLTSANSLEDIQKQIDLFGTMLAKEQKAKEINDGINAKVEKMKEDQPEEKPRALLVYGAPGTNMAALPNSLSGNLLEIAGGENIASDYPSLEDYPQYAQLNTERIIEANPQVILLMSHGNPEEVKEGFLKEIKQNAGWKDLDAVKNDRFMILPSDLFGTNPGTRVTEALDQLSKIFQEME